MNLDAELERLYASPFAAGHTFLEDLAAHFEHGYVWSSPTAFIMARLVSSTWGPERWGNLRETDPSGNAWCVWVAVGDLREFFRVCPQETKFACFARRGFPRLWPFEKLKRLSYGFYDAKSSRPSASASSCSSAGA